MATGLANTGLPTTAEHNGERLIQQQLHRAGRYVKWVEAGSQLLTLLIATLIFFLAAALIDHWIISLGWFGRWLLCLTFVAGSGWFVATRLLPLLVRAVNPAYSAHAIEEATPTLKNSLLNFLLLQKDHAGVKQSVMHALESRAASDISTIEVETAIDRAPLIRMGYILCGAMAIVALYKIASPKDPFQTAARVVAPWSDIARPSRVMIREVQPGHTSVYLGSQVEVTADVRGARGKDDVRLVYTSSDGQVVDRAIVMKNTAGGNRYLATLPGPSSDQPLGRTGSLPGVPGLQQGVQYHIEAGDAISSIYEIRVRMAPTIAVERAELSFPAYTLKQPQSQPSGEIKALEGTRVTIHARANQPIKSAYLELDPRPGRAGETVQLQVDGQNASGGFTLQLKADRVTPWRESYQVRFTNEQGEVSEQPVIHRLNVTPDLPPEVEILQPRLQQIDLPADGQLTIEARGVDPDFALFDLHVAGKSAAGELFRKTLLPPGAPQSQASGKFDFVPASYNLKAGTVVTYQAIAVDNRRDPVTGQPQPGRAATPEYTINIVAPRKPNPNEAQNPNAQPNQQPNDPQQQNNPGENKQPMKPGENPPNNPQQPPMPGEQKPPMPGENPNSENKPGENPQDKPPPNKPQDKPDKGQQNSQQQKPESGQSGEGQGGQSTQGSGNNAQPGSGSGQPNNNSQPNNNPPMPMPGENPAGNSGDNPGNAQSQPSGNGGQPGGAQKQPGDQSGTGQSNPADPNQSGSESDPAGGNPNVREGSGGQSSGKPEHDGEKFEKLLEQLKQRYEEEKKKNEGGGQSTGQQPPNNSAQKPTPQKPDGQGGQPGKPNGDPSAKEKETSEQLLKELEKMVKEQQAKDAREGKSPKPQDQTAQENSQQPMPGQADQQPNGTPMPGGQNNNSNNATGQKPQGGQPVGQPKPGEAKPGEQKPGQQGDPQNATNPKPNEGGSPQGPPRNEGTQPMPMPKPGEQKNPGAGENGNPREGGEQSKDPTGSAQGNEQAQDKPMQSKPGNEGGDPNANEASAPAQGKKNSDTQGATSGDQRGNGKQGPGQPGGAKGNDSAGKSSPGDDGAGRANEQGKGETGNKAGKGPEAAGKTGQPGGQKPGEGTESKAGEKGSESGKGGQPAKKPGEKGGNEPGGSNSGGDQVGPGKPTGAGSAGDQTGKGITKKSDDAADEANLEYTRRVTDLVLQSLRDQQHNPDPELAKRNGLTPQELQEFARRWSQLKKDAENDPAKARELDEALRSLGMRDPKNRRRSESSTDKQRDLRDAGGRTQAPSKYREQFDQFRKSTGK